MTAATAPALSYCRLCSGLCGVAIELDGAGRLRQVRADREHPMSLGYACSKGLAAPETHNHPDRLLHPLKRQADGSYAKIPLEQALDEIAAQVQRIVARDGAEAVAAYRGTASYLNALALVMVPLWLRAIGSSSLFSTMTIDQSAKWVTVERLGRWHAGRHPFERAEVCLIFGANPLVSVQGGLGISSLNPAKRLAQARERGLKLIVVDPRRSELARHADVHLQVYPGEDVSVAAGLLHIILREGWQDAAFCERWVGDLAPLRDAVGPFTPAYVANRAGIAASDLVQAARMFAADARLGAASSGTGPDMGPHSNLAEHLIECLNVVCGRYQRAGDPVLNPGVMSRPAPLHAEVRAPKRSWETGPRSRVRGLGRLMGEKLSGAMADEILQPGSGQIKALFVVGGNPASALPDQQRAVEALASLELLVAIEPFMSTTAQLAHYILPPKLQYERADFPTLADPAYYPEPFAQYTAALAAPPSDGVSDEWWIFWSLAQRLGTPIRLRGRALDQPVAPTSDELLDLLLHDARIPTAELRKHPRGKRFDLPAEQVQPARETATGRFAVLPADVADELACVLAETTVRGAYGGDTERPYTHLLAVRRMRAVLNTTLHNHASVARLHPTNPLAMHPDDAQALQLSEGALVRVIGEHGSIEAVIEVDGHQKPGVVAMSHGWGGLPDRPGDVRRGGVCTSLLVSDRHDLEPINSMPRMTALPVRFERLENVPA